MATVITEQWIRDKLQLFHPCLGDVRSLSLPGTFDEKIGHLGNALNNFIRLKSLDLSYNALVSVEPLKLVRSLERLILYHNLIPSLKEVKVLTKLPNLQELDLRLNPVSRNNPHYRSYLVDAMPNLRKLDSCSIRDSERRNVILELSSDFSPQEKRTSLNVCEDEGSSSSHFSFVDHFTKRFSLSGDSQDIVLNQVENDYDAKARTFPSSFHKKGREQSGGSVRQWSSTPNKGSSKSILRCTGNKKDKFPQNGSRSHDPSHKKSFPSARPADKPKVSFSPHTEKRCTECELQDERDSSIHTRYRAKGHFTPNPDQSQDRSFSLINVRPPSPLERGLKLSDPCNPILHPSRLTYASFNPTEGGANMKLEAERMKKGCYRKPLEMLLNLMDKHWRGEGSLQRNNNFLSQAVQILTMMENDISSREAEVRNLRRDVDALRCRAVAQEEKHQSDMRNLCAQLKEAHKKEGKLNEQLKAVLEENVSLQRQLLKLEHQYVQILIKRSECAQLRETQTEVEELRDEIERLRAKVQEGEKIKDLSNMLHESHQSLVATNECLLAELRGSREHLRQM